MSHTKDGKQQNEIKFYLHVFLEHFHSVRMTVLALNHTNWISSQRYSHNLGISFVLEAAQGAERYFKVNTESEAVEDGGCGGDSKWFQ